MVQAVVDRFEGNKAVLLVGELEDRVVFPKKYLPENINEGDYLKLKIVYDLEMTRAARKEAENLQQGLQEDNK